MARKPKNARDQPSYLLRLILFENSLLYNEVQDSTWYIDFLHNGLTI